MSYENSKESHIIYDHPRRIALVDCNNFYASCERVFKPAWQHKPVAVLSNNDGCIIARSNEVKAAGIPMGAPYFKCKKELDAIGAIVLSSNYSLYGDMSARVMDTLAQYTPDMEIYSIDEAWLDLTGFKLDTLTDYGRQIVKDTHRFTGIPVSMGIAPTKVLAKLANRVCKKQNIKGQVFDLTQVDDLDAVLASVDIEDVWGIGRKLSQKLREKHQIKTALDLKNTDANQMRRLYSVVMQRLILELQGHPCLFAEDVEPKKQIIASRSFGERVTSQDDLMQAISMHTARACEKLRSQGSVAGSISVSIRTSPFQAREPFFSRHASTQFVTPTADTSLMIKGASEALKHIYKKGPKYAKAGVMLNDIQQANEIQQDFFAEPSPKSDALMGVLDAVNQRYGKNTLFYGSQGVQHKWQMKRNNMTPRFTTSWSDIPKV